MTILRKWLFCYLMLLFAGFPCKSVLAQDYTKLSLSHLVIPYTTSPPSNIPLIEVRLSDNVKRHFAFDTGADINIISNELAKELLLEIKPLFTDSGEPAMLAGGRQMSGTKTAFTFAEQTFEATFAAMKISHFPTLAGKRLDGLLGMNILSNMMVYIDPQAKVILLMNTANLTEEDLKLLHLNNAVTLSRVSSDSRSFDVSIEFEGGIKADLTVDTGSDFLSIPEAVAKWLKLKPTEKVDGFTAFGKAKRVFIPVSEIKLGLLTVTDFKTSYLEKASAAVPYQLGMNILSKFRFLIDFKAGKLYLKPLTEQVKNP